MNGEPRSRIFLYGTLRRGGSRDVTVHYDGAEFVASARLRGVLYHLGRYPGLRLDATADWVRGELFDVGPAALAGLDDWEGVEAADPEAGEYRRVRAMARVDGGADEPCWVYEICVERCAGRPVIASGDWLSAR